MEEAGEDTRITGPAGSVVDVAIVVADFVVAASALAASISPAAVLVFVCVPE